MPWPREWHGFTFCMERVRVRRGAWHGTSCMMAIDSTSPSWFGWTNNPAHTSSGATTAFSFPSYRDLRAAAIVHAGVEVAWVVTLVVVVTVF